ncbi:MAG: excinuclease ABC subunit UvrB [Epsilonproteobacteria bacterium]|nr:excinuclease ABC subunit UvrB [Campylobacterota bacterium]
MFNLISEFRPTGDQPEAIDKLAAGIENGKKYQTLLGVTGSGKTFTIANVINKIQKPTLVMSHNKTLAAQLYNEFKRFFPENGVGYFVSYYDYYQPESYIPRTDTYIDKETSRNSEIERLRHYATKILLERRDVIIVASVSAIYGIGDKASYSQMKVEIIKGEQVDLEKLYSKLTEIQYKRNQVAFERGTFRSNGEVTDIFPPDEREQAVRIVVNEDEIAEEVYLFDPITGKRIADLTIAAIYPASHYVTTKNNVRKAILSIKKELAKQINLFRLNAMPLEEERIRQRTEFDIEMLEQVGFCKGIENYSRHLSGKKAGQPPDSLLDFFPEDYLIIIDESHVSLPQTKGMYNGDHSRKKTLVDYGFRLPSALDNRPLKFDEFLGKINRAIFVSATPAQFELEKSGGISAEQLIRPTGLTDPKIRVRPIKNQVDDLAGEIRKRAGKSRVLATALTKRMSEDLSSYYKQIGLKVKYLHSEIDAIERTEIIRALRAGKFDCLIGVNLLREGLDIPEVSLVAILDADKEGFLRSATALIQTIGRAARHINSEAILYADKLTGSIKETIRESARRRIIQKHYNKVHGITPEGIRKAIEGPLGKLSELDYIKPPKEIIPAKRIPKLIKRLEKEMKQAAKNLDFEKAIELRNKIGLLKEQDGFWR